MKLAIVGSRSISHELAFREILKYLYNNHVDLIISGGARGVDRLADEAAIHEHRNFKEILPDWDKHGKAAGFIRNSQIVEECDAVLYIWDGKSRGCMDTVKKAMKAGKPVHGILMRSDEDQRAADHKETLLDSDRCEMCASEMKVSHCKKQCPRCGFMVSCVD